MEVIQTELDGVVIIEPRMFKDARGYFFESYSQKEFDENFFKNCDNVELKFHCKNPILPQNAFENNKYLKRVFFYSTITEIPKKCFYSRKSCINIVF